MNRAKILCLPARIASNGDRDSMPLVVKEAMVRSVPVVASDVAAIPEMVDSTVGRLVPPDNPMALANGLNQLLAMSNDERGRLGAAGRRRVLDRFTLASEVARMHLILSEAVGGTE
jgi:glycosyltransferase involved in cell wall biosynthesis